MCKLDPAWVVLLVSIVCSFAGPLITAKINNTHQLKMRTIDIQEKLAETYDQNRREAICSFMSSVGKVLATGIADDLEDLGHAFSVCTPMFPMTSGSVWILSTSLLLLTEIFLIAKKPSQASRQTCPLC